MLKDVEMLKCKLRTVKSEFCIILHDFGCWIGEVTIEILDLRGIVDKCTMAEGRLG
jgi:hypothetical protein